VDHFEYQQGRLFCEEVAIETLAETYGTPLFVYSRATLERHWHAFDRHSPPTITWFAMPSRPIPAWQC
jgi:diaminopimelate decarboxylase